MRTILIILLLLPSLANAGNVTVYTTDNVSGITIFHLGRTCALTPHSYMIGDIDKLRVITAAKSFHTSWSTFDAMPGDYIKVQDISGLWVAKFMFSRMEPEIAKKELASMQPAEYCIR